MAQHLKDTGQHNDDTDSGNTERRVDTFRTLSWVNTSGHSDGSTLQDIELGQHFRTLSWVNTSGH